VGILLFLIGLLAAGSGAVKLLRGARGSGVRPPFAVVEVVVGSAVILASGMGLGRARPLAWVAVASAVAAIAAGSAAHVRAGLRDQARRAASEEARFRRYLGRPGS
jgi:hypothetical protein